MASQAQKVYFNNRYNTDPEFKERQQKMCRLRYVPKSKKCESCRKKMDLETEDTICSTCQNPPAKRARGRPRKLVVETIDKEPIAQLDNLSLS